MHSVQRGQCCMQTARKWPVRSAWPLQGHGEVSRRELGGLEAGPAWDSPDEFADLQEPKPTLLNRLGFRRSARPATPPEGLPPWRQQLL